MLLKISHFLRGIIFVLAAWSATLPVHAQQQPVAEVKAVAPGVFVFSGPHELFTPFNYGAISNAGFIVGSKAVAVIDTGGSHKAGSALLRAIRQHTDLPVRYVINTHMHPDHVFGNSAFTAEGSTFIGHHKLHKALSARSAHYLRANAALLGDAFKGTKIILPDTGVKDRMELDLGDRIIVLEAFPTAHTDNDLTVYDQKTSTLFTGDLLFIRHIPVVDGSIKGWLQTIKHLTSRKVSTVVPGHGKPSSSWPQALAPQRRYLTGLVNEIRDYIDQGKTLAAAAKKAGRSESEAWALFDAFNARNVSAVFAELEWE